MMINKKRFMRVPSRARLISRSALALLFLLSAVALAPDAAGQRRAPVRRRTAPQAKRPALSPEVRAALERISADSMRGHLSFIASDLLEGRNTPSRGLDLAAEYIAAQFRRAGLEPVGDDGYFQTAAWPVRERSMEGFEMTLAAQGGETVRLGADEVSLTQGVQGRVLRSVGNDALALDAAPVLRVDYADAAALAALTPEQVRGKVVITELPDFRREERARQSEVYRAQQQFLARLGELGGVLVLSVDRQNTRGTGAGAPQLVMPERRVASGASAGGAQRQTPFVVAHGAAVARLYDSLKAGQPSATLSARVPAQSEREAKVRNVVGLLRGSDPVLKDTYVILSAHYDHVGLGEAGAVDRVFNGANDDGSGTVSVIEIASALSALKTKPKRSILFMTFFGEEKGLLGSRHYGGRPVFPIEKTVAQVNLEQVGRTDDSEGPQVSTATVTGFDYSDIGETLRAAGARVGVQVYKHPRNSDAFFGRSDNQSLADQGVPAHTVGVTFMFPDYHAVGDEWQKIDYDNMSKVARMVALGLLTIANSAREPRWNEANPKAARYVQAWRERRGK